MKAKKGRKLSRGASEVTMGKINTKANAEAPDFLVRLVGKTRANRLCREKVVHRRRD